MSGPGRWALPLRLLHLTFPTYEEPGIGPWNVPRRLTFAFHSQRPQRSGGEFSPIDPTTRADHEALQIRATRSAISFSPARSTISFFAHPKLPFKIIASGATWLSRFGPVFQTSAPRHEAKRRSAFAFLRFYKLTARHDHGQPTQLRLNSSEPRRTCTFGRADFSHRNEIEAAGGDLARIEDAYRRFRELEHYAHANIGSLMDYGRAWRHGEPISTADIE